MAVCQAFIWLSEIESHAFLVSNGLHPPTPTTTIRSPAVTGLSNWQGSTNPFEPTSQTLNWMIPRGMGDGTAAADLVMPQPVRSDEMRNKHITVRITINCFTLPPRPGPN